MATGEAAKRQPGGAHRGPIGQLAGVWLVEGVGAHGLADRPQPLTQSGGGGGVQVLLEDRIAVLA